MKPGMTIVPEQSITSASAEIAGAIWAIVFPLIKTSAFSKSPTLGSSESTTPPRNRMGRLRPSPMRFWVAVCEADPPPPGVWVQDAAASAAALAVAVRNVRRDRGSHDELVDMIPPRTKIEPVYQRQIAAVRRGEGAD